MPNDLPDWTALLSVNLVAASGALEGDVSGAALAPDAVTETVQPSQPLTAGNHGFSLASMKPAAGSVIAQVGNLGPRTDGTNVAVNPTFGQATVAGHLLVAWVSAKGVVPATVSAGWVLAVGVGPTPQASNRIFIKPNCGAGEAPPQFTAVGGTAPMRAVLGEFSGVLAAAPTDQITSGGLAGSPGVAANIFSDVGFGDLVLYAFSWQLSAAGTATFSDSMNNRATIVAAGDDGGFSLDVHNRFGYGITVAPTAALPLGVQAWPYDVVASSAPGVGVAASVVLPAVAGKAYTLAMIAAVMVATTAAADRQTFQILDGAAVIFSRIMAFDAVIDHKDSFDVNMLGIRGTPGNSMTIRIAASAAGGQQTIAVGAYLR